jgi:HlyD family secretion protein
MLNMDDPDSAVIVSLYDPQKLQARIDVPLTEAAGIQEGQSVDLTSDILPDTVFHGKVTRISGQADIQRNTLQVKVEIQNPDHRLRPEMLVRGKFFSQSPSKLSTSSANSNRLALFVPEEAIFNNNSAWVVSTDQTAELRTIQLGDKNRDGHRLILDGLRSGEQVILPPHTDLTQGARVTSH